MIFIFLLGSCFGSFIHAMADRYLSTISSCWSFCPYCFKELQWFEKIPIFSFLFQKGRCLSCHHTLPLSYLLFEGFSGLICLLFWILHGSTLLFFYYVFISFVLLYGAKVDWESSTIPDRVHLFLGFLFIIQFLCVPFSLLSHLIGAFLYALPLFFCSLKKWIGFGDVKLIFFLGLLLGFSKIIPLTSLASIFALFHYPFLKKKTIPFCPYIFLSFIFSAFVFF